MLLTLFCGDPEKNTDSAIIKAVLSLIPTGDPVGGIIAVSYRCEIGQCRIAVIGAIVRRKKEKQGAELLTHRPPPVRFCTGRETAHSPVPCVSVLMVSTSPVLCKRLGTPRESILA